MQLRFVGVGLAVVALLSLGVLGADVPPMEVVELGPRAIVVRVADAPTANQTLAVATAAGIILVDSQPTPTLALECRRLVMEHFGRADITHVILTHEDMDHIGGTAAFAGATIVAQSACARIARAVRADVQGVTAGLRAWDSGRIARLEAELATLDAGSTRAREIRAEIVTCEVCIGDYDSGVWIPLVPTATFAETWALDAGDTTVTCWFLGIGHSESDILVHFEEEGILAVGDALSQRYLCITADPELADAVDVGHWCRSLDLALAKSFDTVVWGHRGFLTRADVENRAGYIQALQDGVLALKENHSMLADAHTTLLLSDLFPDLDATMAGMANLLGVPEPAVRTEAEAQHAANIDAFWLVVR